MAFNPFEPQGYDAFSDWAQKAHKEAFVRRKLLFTPDTLTSHTTLGVFHKVNPNSATIRDNLDCPPCECEESEWDFQIKFLFPDGGGSGNVELFDLVNAEEWDVPEPEGHDPEINGYFWTQSGVRLTRKIQLPFVITLIEVFREPLPDLVQVGNTTYNNFGPHFFYGPIDAPNPNNTQGWPFTATALSRGYLQDGQVNASVTNAGYPLVIGGFEQTGDYYWGGMLKMDMRPDAVINDVFGGYTAMLDRLVPPGTVIALQGKVQKWVGAPLED